MDEALKRLAQAVGEALLARSMTLTVAESCTGGLIGGALTAIPGASTWFDRGFITYSNEAKQEMLGVCANTLREYGAVSEETAQEMAAGALAQSHADVAVAITGIAGPGGGALQKPVGLVCFAWAIQGGLARSSTRQFSGDREAVRCQAVKAALEEVLDLLRDLDVVRATVKGSPATVAPGDGDS